MHAMTRTALSVVGVALTLCAPGCRRAAARSGVSDSTFVATMAALQMIDTDDTKDSAAKAAARQRVLQERGLSPAQLERAARAYAGNPERATRIWSRIDSTAQQLGGAPRRPAAM